MQKSIELPIYGITLELNGDGGGSISSDLNDEVDGENEWEASVDALESLILAHACAGIDVTAPAYIEGIQTAVEAITNNLL
jgi:hypothetical protein